MVKRLKLNEKTLREAEPKPGVSYQIFDTEVIGFAARVQASGARTFTIDYRHAGRQRRMTIGRWPEWSVTAARERAKELRRAIDEGQDPLAARDEWRGAPRVTDMIDRYIAEHLPKLAKTNAGDQVSMLKKMVEPAWGNRLVAEITKTDIAKFLDFVAEGRPRPCKAKPNNRARKLQGHKPTPIRANRMGEVLRKMFTLAVEWEWRTDNPAQGFHRRIEHARERFLSPEELTRLAAVLDGAEDQRAAAIKVREVLRAIEDNLLGEAMTSVHALVSREFFDKLIAHPKTEEAYKFYAATGAQPLREDVRRNFPFGGILFEEYSGTVTLSTKATERLVPANEGIAFPLGTMDTFTTYGGPANLLETANTIGLPLYARQHLDEKGRWIDVMTEASILPVNKRPRLAIRLHTSN